MRSIARRVRAVSAANGTLCALRAGDVLEGGAVVPGWEVPVAALFDLQARFLLFDGTALNERTHQATD